MDILAVSGGPNNVTCGPLRKSGIHIFFLFFILLRDDVSLPTTILPELSFFPIIVFDNLDVNRRLHYVCFFSTSFLVSLSINIRSILRCSSILKRFSFVLSYNETTIYGAYTVSIYTNSLRNPLATRNPSIDGTSS